MDWEEMRLFGDALAKPLSITLSFFRTFWYVVSRPVRVARTIAAHASSRTALKEIHDNTVAPGAFLLSSISISVALIGIQLKLTKKPSISLQVKFEENLLLLLVGLVFALLVQVMKGKRKTRSFTLAAFSYVIGSSLFLIILFNLGIAAYAALRGGPLQDLFCDQSPEDLARQLQGIPTTGICGADQLFRGLITIIEFIYMAMFIKVIQGLSWFRTSIALLIAHASEFAFTSLFAYFPHIL